MSLIFSVPATDLKNELELKKPKENQKVLFKVMFKNAGGLGLKFVLNLDDSNVNAEMAHHLNKYFCFVTNGGINPHFKLKPNKAALADCGDYVIGTIKEIKLKSYTIEIKSESDGIFLKFCPCCNNPLELIKNNLTCNYCNYNDKYTLDQISLWYNQRIY